MRNGLSTGLVTAGPGRTPWNVRTVHDSLWRRIFAQPRHAVCLLRLALTADEAARYDWSTLRECPALWFDDSLARSEADLVFLVQRLDGTWDAFVVEHKRGPGRGGLLQLLRYAPHVLERLWSHGVRARLWLVLAHVGTTPWRGPVSLGELLPPSDDPHHVALDPVVLDFAAWSDRDLRAADLTPAGRLCIAAQTCLEGTRAADLASQMLEWQDEWRQLLQEPGGAQDAYAIESYLVRTARLPMGGVLQWMKNARNHPMGTTCVTFEEACHRYHEKKSRRKGLLEGRAEGRAQGREEGRAEGLSAGRAAGLREAQVQFFLHLLVEKFGAGARRMEARARKARTSQLQRWAVRLLTASNLGEVFGRR